MVEQYMEAAHFIKTAILRSQYLAARSVNETQLKLYYGIGRYISHNSRNRHWGQGAIDAISAGLEAELPGLRGFSARNLRYMRTFYEEWAVLETCGDKKLLNDFSINGDSPETGKADAAIWHLQVPNWEAFPAAAFFGIGFTHHRLILASVKDMEARLFYIRRCAEEHYSVDALRRSIQQDDYGHIGKQPNNFIQTIPDEQRAFRAVNAFKDEYLLDFINVEQLGVRDREDIDERVLEQGILHNVKEFIMTFGRDFTFVGNQYHIEMFGESQYIDLLFMNRELNCLVAVELKSGPFKTSYLGQASAYLSILDETVRKPHENQSIGIVLCKSMNKAFVDFVIRDYDKPMGVATYKTSRDMPERLKKALPDMEDLKRLLMSDADREEDM